MFTEVVAKFSNSVEKKLHLSWLKGAEFPSLDVISLD